MDITNQIQACFEIRLQRLALQKQADLLEQEEKTMQYEIQQAMMAAGHNDYTVNGYRAELTKKITATATDWPLTLQWIKATGSVDLLNKRLTESAVKARWDAGIDIPGVIAVPKYVVSISKE